MPLELETWRLVAQWMASLGIALALTALALRSLRGVGLAAGSAGLAGVSTLLALGARAGELDAFPIGSTADFCLGLAAVWLTLAVAAGWRLRPGAPRAAAAVMSMNGTPQRAQMARARALQASISAPIVFDVFDAAAAPPMNPPAAAKTGSRARIVE